MSVVSHQTIKLSRGKHPSPERGACVMELASMLAGESFSDHPVAVSPLLGALMRRYNDYIDDERRQDLYAYASRLVGTRARPAVECRRATRLSRWISEIPGAGIPRSLPTRYLRGLVRLVSPAVPVGDPLALSVDSKLEARFTSLAQRAIKALPPPNDQTHAAVLRLVDELIGIGNAEDPVVDARPECQLALQRARS